MRIRLKNSEIYQHTIKKPVSFRGIGLHCGQRVNLAIRPGPVNSGIRFVRTDINQEVAIPAFMNLVVDTTLATTIAEQETVVATTEHLLAALAGLGIDNAIIELDGPEVPIMDGSAGPFVHILKKVERRRQKGFKRVLKITREISIRDGEKHIRILPHENLRITYEIDFPHDLIRRQSLSLDLSPSGFAEEIATARTFGFLDEVEKLKQNGFAQGGSLENAVVMDRFGVLNEGGLRFADEFVRHKILDLLGDLTLLGCPLIGHVIASKSGHSQHLKLMQEIAARPDCWEFVEFDKNGEDTILERMATTTRAAGTMLLPFLIPRPSPLAGESCPVL